MAIAKGKDPCEYASRCNSIAVVSDGTRVLDLGDICPFGALPVMEGKALLFKAFGGGDDDIIGNPRDGKPCHLDDGTGN